MAPNFGPPIAEEAGQKISRINLTGYFYTMKHISLIALAATVLLLATGAFADSHEAKVQRILPGIQTAVVQQDLIDSLRASNRARDTMSRAEIDKLEAAWKPQRDASVRPLIDSVVENPLAARMRKVIEDNGPMIIEIGVIDANGLSIAQSSVNSDIWQGEEVKFTKTFKAGPGAVFIDEIEFDSATRSHQSQASFSVTDPDTRKVIGAVTVGLNVDALN